jgi:hypothetical protein
MTQQRFREVLKEYGVKTLTTIKPEKITEEQLRGLLEALLLEIGEKK